MPPVIAVENISKSYRLGSIGGSSFREEFSKGWKNLFRHSAPPAQEFWALKEIHFSIQEGEILGIVGRNGAGKSTLLKILSRVTAPTSGVVKIKGRIASLLEVGTGFHPELSGRDNIFLNGAILGMSKAEIRRKFDEIVAFSEISDFIDTPVKRYSSGMYVRLAFAVAAHLESEILIVDEVLAVGDAQFQKKCLGKIGEITSKEKRTVLFVSHHLESVRKLCNTALLLQNGKLITHGTVDQVLQTFLNEPTETHSSTFIRYPEKPLDQFHLQKIELLDEQGELKRTLQTWDYVRFRITFHSPRPLKSGAVNFHLNTPSGTRLLLASNSPEQSFTLNYREGTNQIDCVLSKLMLAAGHYLIGASLAVPNIECLYDGVDHALIEVQSKDIYDSGLAPHSHRALIPMDCHWELP